MQEENYQKAAINLNKLDKKLKNLLDLAGLLHLKRYITADGLSVILISSIGHVQVCVESCDLSAGITGDFKRRSLFYGSLTDLVIRELCNY